MNTTLTLLTLAALGLTTGHSAASSNQISKQEQPTAVWRVATAGPVWVGTWNCKSRNTGGIQTVIAAANGDYTLSTDEHRFDGEWAAVSESEYYYLIPYVTEGMITVKPTSNGFTAIGAGDTFDCTPSS